MAQQSSEVECMRKQNYVLTESEREGVVKVIGERIDSFKLESIQEVLLTRGIHLDKNLKCNKHIGMLTNKLTES